MNTVILVHLDRGIGGGPLHTIYLYQTLYTANITSTILIIKNTIMEQRLKALGLPYEAISGAGLWYFNFFLKIKACVKLLLMCKKTGPCFVQCCNERDLWAARQVARFYSIKIIFVRHDSNQIKHKKIRSVLGTLGAGTQTVVMLENTNKTYHLGIRHSALLPLFFDQKKFLAHQPTGSRADFFNKNFGIKLPETSRCCCMIAMMYSNLSHKNHPLLFQALKIINADKPINEKIHVLLVGDGPQKAYLHTLAKNMEIIDVVHFLGFTDQTPDILYHSDFFVLSSQKEGSPIAFLEAGLMKKASIGALGSGAENIILHEKTGLLFENNNATDLAAKIERLINDPLLCQQLGERAYQFVMKNHSNDINLQKMLHFYKKLQFLNRCHKKGSPHAPKN